MRNKGKILLVLMPFWDPLIPPMGIACLKSYLVSYGHNVKTLDINVEPQFNQVYDNYFSTLKGYIPEHRCSNFYSIGKDVLRNHMMAHLNKTDHGQYIELVKEIVYSVYFSPITDIQVETLNNIIWEFYTRLENYVVHMLEVENPTVLGISVFKGTVPASLFAFKLTKKWFPEIQTIMGGGIFADQLAPGSPDWDLFLAKTTYIDKIFVGEGEKLFLKYLNGELPSSRKVFSIEDIGNKYMDISRSKIPDFSDFNILFYPYMASYTSRSCPYQCQFCSETVCWGEYRKKTATQVVREMKQLVDLHGFQLFMMCDSLLNPVINGLSKKLLSEKSSIYWDGYLKVENQVCDPDNTLKWRRGGFYRARLGIESGSERVLKLMNKSTNTGQIQKALKHLANCGIKTTTYWVVGYPGETEQDFQDTLGLLERLKDNIYEADFSAFWYFYTGQVNSSEWANKSQLLYPEEAKNMLLLQTRILNEEPSRKETYNRMIRFSEHCVKLGIPNPYSLHDIHKADQRWQALHENAVPPLLQFNNKANQINECKKVTYIIPRNTQLSEEEKQHLLAQSYSSESGDYYDFI